MAGMTGGCLCGNIRYRATRDPERTVVCHCTICQRHTGSAFATFIGFARGSVEVIGDLKTFVAPGGTTGKPVTRKFCSNCGTPIILEVDGGERTLIAAGTLDDTSVVKPTVNIFCESAQPWVPITPDMPNYPRYPT